MPNLSALLAALKSPKAALAVFLFSAAFFFAPFDRLDLTHPAFTAEYESFFFIILLLSAAILAVEVLSKGWRLALRLYYARKRKKRVEETFLSLNVQELCVLWAMTQSSIKTIQGSSTNLLMLSLRQKGCLRLVSGIQFANQLHHEMPDEIFKIVTERGYNRIPDNIKNSDRFEDEVRSILQAATDPSS